MTIKAAESLHLVSFFADRVHVAELHESIRAHENPKASGSGFKGVWGQRFRPMCRAPLRIGSRTGTPSLAYIPALDSLADDGAYIFFHSLGYIV